MICKPASHVQVSSLLLTCPCHCHAATKQWHLVRPSWARLRHERQSKRYVCSATADSFALDVKRALDKAERARSSWAVEVTDFYPPPVVAEVQKVTNTWSDITVQVWGGYAQAERCRLLFGREEIMQTEAAESETVAALNVSGNFMFDEASHRDFLGALVGTGIERRTIGDILIQRDVGAQILCTQEISQYLLVSVDQTSRAFRFRTGSKFRTLGPEVWAQLGVRTSPVKVSLLPLQDLKVPVPKVKEIRCMEMSMRVDAIASAGFRMSRSKMSDLVKKGDVRVNWLECTKPSVSVAEGDVISVAGKGRMTVGEVTTTAKGKFAVELTVNL